MAWRGQEIATVFSGISYEQVFQKDGADWKIELNPGESAHVQFKSNMGATDDVKFTVYGAAYNSPGAVPDYAQTLAGSDWHIVTEITVDNVNDDNKWQGVVISGYRYFAVSIQRVGTTDASITGELVVNRDGVSAS